MHGKKLPEALRYVILSVSVCVLVYSLFNIAKRLYGYYNDSRQYEKIRSYVASGERPDRFGKAFGANFPAAAGGGRSEGQFWEKGAPEDEGHGVPPYVIVTGNPAELDANEILRDYSELKKINNDVIGWIEMPGFGKKIEYPVMKGKDDKYYLNKDFYGNFSYAGSIFIDSRNNPQQVDRHIILYGHAMRDFSMFGNLRDYPKKPEYYTSITKVYLDFMNTRLEYEVFSTYIERSGYNYRQTGFANDGEYMEFLKRICGKSVYNYGAELTPMDKVLTLSTCNDSFGGDGRSIVHARLTRQIVYEPQTATPTDVAGKSAGSEKKAVSANVYLLKLSVVYGDAENSQEAVLNPTFDAKYREFSCEVPPDTEKVSLIIETADPEAKVHVIRNEKDADPGNLPLEYGENVIRARVVSRDGQYARTYTVNIIRNPMPISYPSP